MQFQSSIRFGNFTCIDKVNENMKKEGGPNTNIGGVNRKLPKRIQL